MSVKHVVSYLKHRSDYLLTSITEKPDEANLDGSSNPEIRAFAHTIFYKWYAKLCEASLSVWIGNHPNPSKVK